MSQETNTTNASPATTGQTQLDTYRISDEATSTEITADDLNGAVKNYLLKYDTAEMESGETFTARVFTGDDLLDLAAVVTVTADGKSGVTSHEISLR